MPAKIMIVDDEPEVVRLLEVILIRSGYAVAKAYSGKECLALIGPEKPDAILLDIMMPGMSGLEVMHALRLVYNTRRNMPPVIFLTAKGGMEAMIEGLQAGAYKYLVKPTSREKLVAVVRSALEDNAARNRPPSETDWR